MGLLRRGSGGSIKWSLDCVSYAVWRFLRIGLGVSLTAYMLCYLHWPFIFDEVFLNPFQSQ